MNKVKPFNVGASLAGTVVVLYLLCALVVALAPGAAESVLRMVAHSANVDVVFQPERIDFVNVLGGTVAVAIYFFVIGAVFGWIYNLFGRE